MLGKLKRLIRDESGITALETAIILIAFVVVAAVFAFTILSAGTYLTERSKEAAYAGLEEVRGSMELRGSVIITTTAVDSDTVDAVIFNVANVAGGQPIDLTDDAGSQVVRITYRDQNQNVDLNAQSGNQKWTVSFIGNNNGDEILEHNELAEIRVDISSTGTVNPALGTNKTFAIEVLPPQGAVLLIERTTPAKIDPVTDLH